MITPIEYVEGNYYERDDIVVWHEGYQVYDISYFVDIVDRVRSIPCKRRGYHVVYVSDDIAPHHADIFDHCLTVEQLNYPALRNRAHDIVDSLSDKILLEVLEQLQTVFAEGS
jgi:hypothetical protein